MVINTILILTAIVVTVLLMVAMDWRWKIFGLSMAYLISFLLIIQIWPIALAAVKLISGLIGVVLLSSVEINLDKDDKDPTISYRVIVLLITVLSWMIVLATINRLNEWLPISYTNLYVGLTFLLAGLILVALFQDMFSLVVGLLVFLTGFDVIYSSLEGSALVAGIYGLILLAISILGGYLESAQTVEVRS